MYCYVKTILVLFFVLVMAVDVQAVSIIDSGVSDPTSSVTGQEFFRTDLGTHEIYTNGQWIKQDLGVFNAKAFGAKGDGITDDTAAIQAAIDAVPSSGGVVFIPVGIYRLTSTINLKPNMVLRGGASKGCGDGLGSTGTKLLCQHNGNGLSLSSPEASLANILIENMGIEGFKDTYSTGHGIYINNQFDGMLRNLVVSAFPQDNIHIDGGDKSWHIYIRECYAPHAGNACYYINSAHCSLQKAVSDGGSYGLIIPRDGGCCDVRGCHFEGALEAGIKLSGGLSRIVSNIICACKKKGIMTDPDVYRDPGAVIADNTIMGSGTVGIDLNQSHIGRYQISNNLIQHFTTGIKDYSYGQNTYTGNLIFGTGSGGIGIEVNPANGYLPMTVVGNIVQGSLYSIKHVHGDKVMYVGNFTLDGSGTVNKPITVVAGNPTIIPEP